MFDSYDLLCKNSNQTTLPTPLPLITFNSSYVWLSIRPMMHQ